jgi:LVIVD repeat
MRSVAVRLAWGVAAAVAVVLLAGAQEKDRPAGAPTDPRVGLKAGLRNAGEAARGMELVANLPKPAGFFDPKAPAGTPTGPEPDPKAPEEEEVEPRTESETRRQQQRAAGLNFANSDLAFSGTHLFVGNFNGFNIYDIANPRKPKLITSVVCPGGQGDLSVHGNLLVMSVEQTRGRVDCGIEGVPMPVSAERFRGVRIFDISDLKKPKQVAAVQTCRGSHTHTLVANPKDPANLYVYGSGTGTVRSAEELAGCSGLSPKEDPNTALFSIDVIQVPIAAPQTAHVVNRPRIFADPTTGAISGLWPGGSHGPGTQSTRLTNQCHDITVYPEIGLAAGACAGNGILLDISDPVKPVRLDQVVDKNFAYWHSATFNNDGTKVIFTDEWGGGTRPRCRASDLPTWGANAIFDIVDRKMRFGAYYKLPAPQTEQENCVAHNGSLIPVPGRDIMVQAWYQGGVSVFDFTDSAKPVEIAFFDRGPIDARQLITGGHWSTYWYNGFIYGTEMARGLDVLRLTPGEHLTQNEIDAAASVQIAVLNAQQQPKIVWPATAVVARAYLDQLGRSKGIQPERAAAVSAALERADKVRSARDGGAATVAGQLEQVAAQLETDAGASTGRDAARLRSLAATLKGRANGLR